jgi:hypothetical protein
MLNTTQAALRETLNHLDDTDNEAQELHELLEEADERERKLKLENITLRMAGKYVVNELKALRERVHQFEHGEALVLREFHDPDEQGNFWALFAGDVLIANVPNYFDFMNGWMNCSPARVDVQPLG